MTKPPSCTNNTPPRFVGHWRDWHRGHGCDKDDSLPRTAAATTEIEQIAENANTGYLTDAELSFLRASTTSGNTLLVRALDELTAHRAGTVTSDLTTTELNSLRGSSSSSGNTLLKRAISELTARRSDTRAR
jgi:hypothetical protein